MHVFVLLSPVETLGALFEVLCVELNIMNLKLFDVYHAYGFSLV